VSEADRPAAARAAVLSVLGFLVLITFVAHLDSLGTHMSLASSLLVFGTSWLLHLPLALLLGGVIWTASRLLGATRLGRALPTAVYVSAFLLAAWLGLRALVPSMGSSTAAALAIGTGLLAGVLRPGMAASVAPAARTLAILGIPFALAAIGAGLWHRSAATAVQPAPDPSRPDILIITMDALANGHLSSMGYPRPTTPQLDRIARDGAQFERLVASSNFTTPTINSLLTGQRPWRHKALQLPAKPLPGARETSLPARLHAAGYAVRAVTTNPWAGIHRNGYSRWFDAVAPDQTLSLGPCRDDLSLWLPDACAARDLGLLPPLTRALNKIALTLGLWTGADVFDARRALAAGAPLFRRPADGRPVMLWIHLWPPHDPYVAPEPHMGRFDPSPRLRTPKEAVPIYQEGFIQQQADHALLQARYDEMISAVDSAVGDFLRDQRAAGRLANAIVLVSADHGESFLPAYGGHAGPLLHPAVTNIPLILLAPGITPGSRVAVPVEQVDLAPTLLELAGVAPRPGSMDGRSLVPLLTGGSLPDVPLFTMNLERQSRYRPPTDGSAAILYRGWKFTHHWGRHAGMSGLSDSLTDTQADWLETANQLAADPARAEALKTMLVAERTRALSPP
jgi:arylsulfatase A-like enzyme